MMSALLERLLLVALIVASGVVPGFIQQYRQQVNGRLEQVRADLEPFISIARQRHGGDLQRLVDHHLASSDVTFVRVGDAINAMVDSMASLTDANAALDAPLVAQVWYLAGHADRAIAAATWQVFEPAFVLTTQGVVFALVAGVAVWVFLLGIGRAARAGFRAFLSSRSAAR